MMLEVTINNKIKDSSIEFMSMVDENKFGSFQMQNLVGLNVLGNKRERISIQRQMKFKLEEFKILHFTEAKISCGGGYL